ncbi:MULTISPECIES: cell division protein FtsQ/DivIB [unclassified Halomonas]|uniref:cell division protein FtsQ/DivIB n=1 Tax=unclassified Halomonas TaxID=2609666 RepID=UPI0006DB2A53|nr:MULTISPECIES: cell division protein FtsQ/DivIB [unclassified Halomonas]KPQ26606.1 MAG: cell division protein FtsQ [Halomonas sp. HL-93]SBR49587.1 cell division protein FtsQ [Halomonas sp. HL-93]SNY96441.1 cell division protein FtsQ [Halomonas sp. hl-4]
MKKRQAWLGGLMLGLLLVAGGQALWLWLDRPIERVSIRGDWQYVDADYLRTQLAPVVEDRQWLSADLSAIRRQALRIGWLHEVRITREWPNTLVFELVEQTPVARWNDDFLLNEEGEAFAFAPLGVPQGLPDMAGPAGSSEEVLNYYHQLTPHFARLDLRLTQLRLEPRGAWRLQLNDSAWVMLGRRQHEVRLARLSASWQRELSRLSERIRYIDLRYPNGVAVAWHGESEFDVQEE